MVASQACAVVAPKQGLTLKVSAVIPLTVQPSLNAARSSSWRTRRGPIAGLAVAEAHQVAVPPGSTEPGCDVPGAAVVVEDVEQPAVDDRVEGQAEPAEVQRVADLERAASPLGCLGAGPLDRQRGVVDPSVVRPCAAASRVCSPVPQPRPGRARSAPLVRQPDERRPAGQADVPGAEHAPAGPTTRPSPGRGVGLAHGAKDTRRPGTGRTGRVASRGVTGRGGYRSKRSSRVRRAAGTLAGGGQTARRRRLMPSTDGTLSARDPELLRKDFSANPAYRLAQNAVTRVDRRRRGDQPGDHQQHRPLALRPAGRLEGHQSGAQRPVLAVRRAQPAARRRHEEDGAQGLRVLAELRDVLGQDRAGQLLPRGRHRDGRPRHRRPDRRLPPRLGGRRRRPVEHVRGHRQQARPGAQGVHAGDPELRPTPAG